jgi:RHS repeat-associated protein
MTDAAGANNYTYDSLDRLTAATHPNQTNESYTFDDVGNRTASHQGSSYTYQPFNRLTAANSNSYSYDSNGNLTSKTDASGSWTYIWDYENRLKQASKASGVTVSYAYDALGRRIQRASSAGATKFVYDGPDVVRDLDGNGNTVADYLNGSGIDNKLRQTTSGTTSYFATDHLGTTRALTDVSGNLTSALGYDSFGNVASGAATTRYTYTGREIDFGTGLYYYRARWYNPPEGRFVSDDPIGLTGGLNLFAYVKNQPLRFRDPEGLRPLISADDFGDPYRGERSRFDPNHKGPVDRFVDRFVDPYLESVFGGGGLFRRDVFVEFISANERSRQPCKAFGERFVRSFTETNAAIPGLAAPSGAGLAPARNAAEFVGEPTLYRWADNWFAPPNGISNGPFFKSTIVRTGLVSLAVSGAWEAGVGVGSFVDAAGCPCGY